MQETGHRWVAELKPGEPVKGCYLVKDKRVGTARTGNMFLSMTLADRTGDLEAKVWEKAQEFSAVFEKGDILDIEGLAESYKGQLQVSVARLKRCEGEADPSLFLESAPGDPSEMMADLREILKGVQNSHLKGLHDRFLADHDFLKRFKRAPAAKNFHHGYLGGLLEHTLSVCGMAVTVAGHYPRLDRELLLSGAFLHDIGKIRELAWERNIDYTDEGRLLGHLALGVSMLEEKITGMKRFPDGLAARLKHLILSHHGQYEFGSPKRPKFLEAFALHLIDDLDAKINGLGRFMEKDQKAGAWTDYHRLYERYLFKGGIAPDEHPREERSGAAEQQATLFTPRED